MYIMKRYIITVTGRVQGVFFRDTARRTATELGLSGFARNEPDGSVYIEAEGEAPSLERFLEWCRQGSDLSKVESVRFKEDKPTGRKGFFIK